jgi:hypothetical protein
MSDEQMFHVEKNKPQEPKNRFEMDDRDRACLHMKAPISDKPWLNEVIMHGRKLDFLQAVFSGLNEKPKNAEKSAHQSDEWLLSEMIGKAREYGYMILGETDPKS